MKICLDTFRHSYIDIAPLGERYRLMTAAMLALAEAGQMAKLLKLSKGVVRLVNVYTRLQTHNTFLTRKLNMLSDKPWRERVLKELGGMRKLTLWDSAKARIEARRKAKRDTEIQTPPKSAWLYSEDRLAESERLKALAREFARAAVHPNIVRDRCKMDFEGEFRLAPLPRGPRQTKATPSQPRVYTQQSISEYHFNPLPFAPETTLGPAPVWPEEFYLAIEADEIANLSEAAIPKMKPAAKPPVKFVGNRRERRRLKAEAKSGSKSPLAPIRPVTHVKTDRWSHVPRVPVHLVIPQKTYERIFGLPLA